MFQCFNLTVLVFITNDWFLTFEIRVDWTFVVFDIEGDVHLHQPVLEIDHDFTCDDSAYIFFEFSIMTFMDPNHIARLFIIFLVTFHEVHGAATLSSLSIDIIYSTSFSHIDRIGMPHLVIIQGGLFWIPTNYHSLITSFEIGIESRESWHFDIFL